MIKVKRIYESPSPSDGYRILVDGLWPRGIAKGEAKIDLWLKEISPSAKLRKWFSHDPKKWKDFQSRYREEIALKADLVRQIKQLEKENKTVTLLYSTKDEEHNNVVVLSDVLKRGR